MSASVNLEEYVRQQQEQGTLFGASAHGQRAQAFFSGLPWVQTSSAWWKQGGLSRWKAPWRNDESVEAVQEAAQNDPWMPALSRQQRFLGALGFFIAGVACLLIAGLYIPVLALRSRKFAILFTFGSVFIIASLAVLRGPQQHLRSMLNADRLPFTTIYVVSVFATLYVALSMQSSVLTVLCGVVQVCALLWYTLSYIPGGPTGMRFFARMATALVKRGANSAVSASTSQSRLTA
ncbi:uncharacterized protein LOC129590823 isoform X2 [Paramacrobiotus metropolitanus]|uniref:uncharacterized protein LOC129590823 isoform X2 n=1 Tax=Paramacrobiotus metropolitanus TaxID=2943436 RepID=UPI002445F409|nr:uncharacterized protein LOC129590823 isoform X2 [Paramacrobiotus metropolitanus]